VLVRHCSVHVFFVAHPRTLQQWDGKAPGLYDISGSAHFVNKADNGIVVHRNRDPEAENPDHVQIIIRKVRHASAWAPPFSRECTPCRGLHGTPRNSGRCASFKGRFLSPNSYRPIRNVHYAVRKGCGQAQNLRPAVYTISGVSSAAVKQLPLRDFFFVF
jgi:hypothetical protein